MAAAAGVAPAVAGRRSRALAADAGLTVVGVFTHGGHGYAGPDAALAQRRTTRCAALTEAAESLAAAGGAERPS